MAAYSLFVLLALFIAVSLHHVTGESRQKRDLWGLSTLLSKVAGLSKWKQLTKLNKHGNYCGKGSRGSKVMDPLDGCCERHDKCYDKWYGRCGHLLKVKYAYNCKSSCRCTDTSTCGSAACNCDLVFAWCVRRNLRYL